MRSLISLKFFGNRLVREWNRRRSRVSLSIFGFPEFGYDFSRVDRRQPWITRLHLVTSLSCFFNLFKSCLSDLPRLRVHSRQDCANASRIGGCDQIREVLISEPHPPFLTFQITR